MHPEFGHTLRPLWHLDPEIHFLNHGSFGATPIAVLEAQQALRMQMEREPVRFMVDFLPGAIRDAAAALGEFIGAPPQQFAFTANATEAINAVLGSIDWREGDEVVIANHAYPAIRNAVGHVAARHRLIVREAHVPFPLAGDDDVFNAYAAAISARTRLALIDHVFSPLAIVAPVERLVALCRERGVAVLVDGAHAPGAIPLALNDLGADWTVGNAHKWLFAPKGCAFLHAGSSQSCALHPTVISNLHGAGFPAEFDWTGTRDYTAWLALPAAIGFLEGLGSARYQAHLRQQAREAAQRLAEAWQVALPAPPEMFGAMVTLPLPAGFGSSEDDAKRLRLRLLDGFAVEVPVIRITGGLWVRISAQVYNELADYDALSEAVLTLLKRPD